MAQKNIDTDFKLDDLTLIKRLKDLESPFVATIQDVYNQVKDILNTRVQHVFPNYTLHNTGHSFRIIEYMSQIVTDLSMLDELEISLLVLSALLHDIGMAVSQDDIDAIKADSFSYCDTKFSSMKKLTGDDEDLALQEYVRRIHASLSAKYIRENLKEKLLIPKLANLDFVNELALICESHTEDYDWITKNLRVNDVRGNFTFNSQYISCVLRLADILDIDGNRTPYNLYKLIAPKGNSDPEWKQNFIISNNEKIILLENNKQKKVVFHGKSKDASLHRKLQVYINWVQNELINATGLLNTMQPQYHLIFETIPETHIQTEGYKFPDYKMTLEFNAISALLMGEKIYGSKSLGLRELIQNSMDSCRIRQETERLKFEFGEDVYTPKIKVILDEARNQVIIKDNGTGMSLDIIKKHFLNIGVSYYTSTDFLLKDFEYKPIGNFGIGFLSCFMLSENVKVVTRHYLSKNKYIIELEKGNEWTSITETEDYVFEGTEVILDYNNFIGVFGNDIGKVEDFLNQYFLTDGIEFELIEKASKEIKTIVNPIVFSEPTEKGIFKIDLQDYLRDIRGFVLLKKKNNFINSFEDIGFIGDVYIYDNESGLVEVEDFTSLKIDDYLNGEELNYLSIPIVESHLEEDFLSGMKFTDDDASEVISKMNRDLKWIALIVPKDRQVELSGEQMKLNSWIFDTLTFKDLAKVGHSLTCEIQSNVETINLFEGRKNELYLPFDKRDIDSMYNINYRNKKRKELFMRNVLIKDFRFDIPISASVFEINTLVANINSKMFIPDVSRNNVDAQTKTLINYIVGKALHQGIKNVFGLSGDENDTVDKFTRTYYDKKNDFER